MQDLSILAPERQREADPAPVLGRGPLAPDPALCGLVPPRSCLRRGILPLHRSADGVLTLACCDTSPADLATLRHELGPLRPWPVTRDALEAAVIAQSGEELARAAEISVPLHRSCRDFNRPTPAVRVTLVSFVLIVLWGILAAPATTANIVIGLALSAMLAGQLLKVTAFLASRPAPKPAPLPQSPATDRPLVTLLVPLFHERDIAGALLQRLLALRYPRDRLEVLLILEADDTQTRSALDGVRLPRWMRVIDVPDGTVRTKPRAMNYAINFARGEIVGIYDAEDAPDPDQIDRVVARFAEDPEIDCLQGILDYYNPGANWLSRCFTIEYSVWFRLLLPGLVRLGMAIPLGGTTVFVKREVLEAAQGWDAHNVTEDADLGVRLARLGYRTDVLDTVTGEEANNRAWPWVKQRSRWLKGYVITYLVHMRQPRLLWTELGAWRFFGMQLLFLTTILQFTLAPVLWSFWFVMVGMPHPFPTLMGPGAMSFVTFAFVGAEAITLAAGWAALQRSPHQKLWPWVPTLIFYFPLGSLAMYKALWEMGSKPFYWDKTMHGSSAPDASPPETVPAE